MQRIFDFEEKHSDLAVKIAELKDLANKLQINLDGEIEHLEKKMIQVKMDKYQNLTPWEKVLLNRQLQRPGSTDYIEYIFTDWLEFHGDRRYGDDKAIVGGIARLNDVPVTVVGHRKGKSTKENIEYNFGMPHPEGFRKVERLVLQAQKFKRPVITFIDTSGAYPGVGAEERGQAWAIAELLMTMSSLKVPIISIIIGEGGSGGALALGVSDRLIMLSNAVFSVASPEASASILWKRLDAVEEMAAALKITAQDLWARGFIDEIIAEPTDTKDMLPSLGEKIKAQLIKHLPDLQLLSAGELVKRRMTKLREMGTY